MQKKTKNEKDISGNKKKEHSFFSQKWLWGGDDNSPADEMFSEESDLFSNEKASSEKINKAADVLEKYRNKRKAEENSQEKETEKEEIKYRPKRYDLFKDSKSPITNTLPQKEKEKAEKFRKQANMGMKHLSYMSINTVLQSASFILLSLWFGCLTLYLEKPDPLGLFIVCALNPYIYSITFHAFGVIEGIKEGSAVLLGLSLFLLLPFIKPFEAFLSVIPITTVIQVILFGLIGIAISSFVILVEGLLEDYEKEYIKKEKVIDDAFIDRLDGLSLEFYYKLLMGHGLLAAGFMGIYAMTKYFVSNTQVL